MIHGPGRDFASLYASDCSRTEYCDYCDVVHYLNIHVQYRGNTVFNTLDLQLKNGSEYCELCQVNGINTNNIFKALLDDKYLPLVMKFAQSELCLG